MGQRWQWPGLRGPRKQEYACSGERLTRKPICSTLTGKWRPAHLGSVNPCLLIATGRLAWASWTLFVWVLASPVGGEAQVVVLDEGHSAEWDAALRRTLVAEGRRLVVEPRTWVDEELERAGPFLRRRVRVLHEVSGALAEARRLASMLREAEALRVLTRAERILEDHAELPGAAAWLAEVKLLGGVVAAQGARWDLAEAFLEDALVLDPDRGLRIGEAPPALVARANAVGQAIATGPTGSLVVRSRPEGALVYLDDELLGPAPQELRAPTGRHILRLELLGHCPYGRTLEVLEGRRAPVEVTLTADSRVLALGRLGPAFQEGRAEAVGRALDGAGLEEAWSLRRGSRVARALLLRCTSDGCVEPQRASTVDSLGEVVQRAEVAAPVTDLVASAAPHEAWLDEAAAEAAPSPREPWHGWPFWASVAGVAALTVAGLVVGVGLEPNPAPRRDVVVDPCGLPTACR